MYQISTELTSSLTFFFSSVNPFLNKRYVLKKEQHEKEKKNEWKEFIEMFFRVYLRKRLILLNGKNNLATTQVE